MPERTSHAPGTFSWVDLSTSDPEAAKTFYAGLLGWEYTTEETPMGPYAMAFKDGKAVAGLSAHPDEQREMGIPLLLELLPLGHQRRRNGLQGC